MDTNRYLKAVNIEWDVDLAEDLDSLPKEVQIPDGLTDTEEIFVQSDRLLPQRFWT